MHHEFDILTLQLNEFFIAPFPEELENYSGVREIQKDTCTSSFPTFCGYYIKCSQFKTKILNAQYLGAQKALLICDVLFHPIYNSCSNSKYVANQNSGQSYKASTIVIYASRVVNVSNILVIKTLES